jgi:membrane-associated protease RseP (regulator of RpoE activity)
MIRNTCRKCLAWCAVGAAVPWLGQPVKAQDAARDLRSSVRVVAQADGGNVLLRRAEEAIAAQELPQSDYWLGIGLGGELPDVAKRQLGLEHGLVVAEVMDDGPAAKAQVKKLDILLKAGDKPLKEPADLIKAVDAAKDKELSLTIVRDGKDITIKITPVQRPQTELRTGRLELRIPKSELGDEIKRLEDALESLKNKAGKEGSSFWFARPGVVAPRLDFILKPKLAELPKNISVRITKEGDQPAKIHIKKDDKEWDVSEDKLSELPEDVRGHVERFFGRLWAPALVEQAQRSFLGGPTKMAPFAPQSKVPSEPAPPALGARLRTYRLEAGGPDSKLDEIMKEIKQLRKDVDDLRGKSPSDASKK